MANDRTTVNVSKEAHREARKVADEHGESFTDVVKFYAEHRNELAIRAPDGSGGSIDVDAVADAVADRLEGSVQAVDHDELARALARLALADGRDGDGRPNDVLR